MKGPRYWQQAILEGPNGKGKGALAALYASGALPVQLQRWALSYAQDPSGVRGLLSQAFDEVCVLLSFPFLPSYVQDLSGVRGLLLQAFDEVFICLSIPLCGYG